MENNEMNETEHLLSSHANAQRLFEGIEQIERGEIVPFSVEDFEKVINLIHKFYTNESK
jgi:hypothetical protein